MTIRHKYSLFSIVFLTLAISGNLLGSVELVESLQADSATFPLVVGGVAAAIVLPANAPEVVKIAAADLASDIATITGTKPEVLDSPIADKNRPRIELVLPGEPGGRWEAFRLSAKSGVLTITGSDRRGLAYGIYEVSRRIGVSPWNWWSDVPAPRRPELKLSLGDEPVDQPAVKYRGIFINDEDWGLEPWASKTFEPEVKGIGPKTYSRIFELLLRLRANCIWPAMHPTSTPFHLVPGNAATADRYAIVVGSSHAEPMLRNNVGEWKASKDDYNYLRNRNGVLSYWEGRVKERASGESLFTLGMRGIHDSAIVGPKTQPERIATLEHIFTDQRALLAKYLGNGDPSRVGQIFVPYKEVLDDYNAGLKVPADVPIVWPDDNFGYVRRFATDAERKRSGGLGVYYHASYLGLPFAWTWIDALPPALIWSEMTRAYEQGAHAFWIVNVGDLKNTERSTEFFLNLAWHADRTSTDMPAKFILETAARDFGKDHAEAVASILTRMQAINFARRVECLQWHLSLSPYQPTELNETEIQDRLKACADLLRDSDVLAAKLPDSARDAYFQLVGYPAIITAAANRRYFHHELARADGARGRDPTANQEASIVAQEVITGATAHYNNGIAGGKWKNIVTENGVSAKDWKRFKRDTKISYPAPAAENVCPPAPAAPSPLARPNGASVGDFVERDGVVAINAGSYTSREDLPSGAGWRAVPALGRSGSAVTVLPSSVKVTPAASPTLEYRFHLANGGPAKVRVRLVPTHPLVTGQGLRLAVAIDDGPDIPLVVTTGFETGKSTNTFSAWQTRVVENATEATAELPLLLSPGAHTLRLIAVDTGVVVDKIVLDLGGFKPSYDGPVETRIQDH